MVLCCRSNLSHLYADLVWSQSRGGVQAHQHIDHVCASAVESVSVGLVHTRAQLCACVALRVCLCAVQR